MLTTDEANITGGAPPQNFALRFTKLTMTSDATINAGSPGGGKVVRIRVRGH